MKAAFLLCASLLCAAGPDKGGLPLREVDVSEPNQSALIAFDGKTEILYISSLLRPKTKTRLLEILPLPSEPKVEPADPMVIERAAGIYNKHVKREQNRQRRKGMRAMLPVLGFVVAITIPCILYTIHAIRRKQHVRAAVAVLLCAIVVAVIVVPPATLGSQRAAETVDVISQQQIGPHSITVVKAREPKDISLWIEDYFRREGGDAAVFDAAWRSVVESYAKDGYPYFVLDVIDADPASGPVAPLRYTFASGEVYFPLRISSRGKGVSKITLLVLSSVELRGINDYVKKGVYPSWFRPFALAQHEIARIDAPLQAFFGSSPATLRGTSFSVSLPEITEDFVAK